MRKSGCKKCAKADVGNVRNAQTLQQRNQYLIYQQKAIRRRAHDRQAKQHVLVEILVVFTSGDVIIHGVLVMSLLVSVMYATV